MDVNYSSFTRVAVPVVIISFVGFIGYMIGLRCGTYGSVFCPGSNPSSLEAEQVSNHMGGHFAPEDRMPHGQGRREQRQEHFLDRLESKLSLSPEQREKIAGILSAKMERMQEIRTSVMPELEKLNQDTNKSISELLTAEQKETFGHMRKKFEHLKGRMRDRMLPNATSQP